MANVKNRVKTISPVVTRSKNRKQLPKLEKVTKRRPPSQRNKRSSATKENLKKKQIKPKESKLQKVKVEGTASVSKKQVKSKNPKEDVKDNTIVQTIKKEKSSSVFAKVWNEAELIENFLSVSDNFKNMKKSNNGNLFGVYQCDYCKKVYQSKSAIVRHMRIHSEERFGCKECKIRFAHISSLRSHMLSHEGLLKAPELFVCDHCGKPFLRKLQLRVHLAIHAPASIFECSQCPATFSNKNGLSQHEYNHRRGTRYQCTLCKNRYTNRTRLIFHIKSHLGIKDFVCFICGKSFLRPDAFKKHITNTHYETKPYECPICKKKLKGHLQEHMRTHENIKPHNCAVCGKTFAQMTQLRVHNRSHLGQRPYKCRVCAKSFTHSNALTLHIRRHTGERPIGCALCPLRFSQLPHMKAHMKRIHNRDAAYKCDSCDAFFQFKSELSEHRSECKHVEIVIKDEDGFIKPANDVDTPMTLSKMRFLLAILLKNIADDRRLRVLGFNKRLIDDLLVDSLVSTNQNPCIDTALTPAKRLKMNIQLFLDWTVPPVIMERFKKENKSTEELLEELTTY